MISRTRLKSVMSKFPQVRLAVLGDMMLDEFIWGKVERISPEAPVPIVQIKRETKRPGGAANVAGNLTALGAKVDVFGIIGEDGAGRCLVESLKADKIGTSGLIVDSGRRTTVKTRVLGQNQQILRIDREFTDPIDHRCQTDLAEAIWKLSSELDGIIVSDYAKGVICEELLSRIIERFRTAEKPVVIDPRPKNAALYKGASVITPNTHEAEQLLGRTFETEEDVLKAGVDLVTRFKLDAALITRGEQGMSLFERGKKPLTIPTRALEVFDVTGAGDTVTATFTAALAAGCPMAEAAEIANLAAGVVVGIVGTAVASPQAVLEHYDRITLEPSDNGFNG